MREDGGEVVGGRGPGAAARRWRSGAARAAAGPSPPTGTGTAASSWCRPACRRRRRRGWSRGCSPGSTRRTRRQAAPSDDALAPPGAGAVAAATSAVGPGRRRCAGRRRSSSAGGPARRPTAASGSRRGCTACRAGCSTTSSSTSSCTCSRRTTASGSGPRSPATRRPSGRAASSRATSTRRPGGRGTPVTQRLPTSTDRKRPTARRGADADVAVVLARPPTRRGRAPPGVLPERVRTGGRGGRPTRSVEDQIRAAQRCVGGPLRQAPGGREACLASTTVNELPNWFVEEPDQVRREDRPLRTRAPDHPVAPRGGRISRRRSCRVPHARPTSWPLLEDFNERVKAEWRRPAVGPSLPVIARTVAVERMVERWRERLQAVEPAGGRSRSPGAGSREPADDRVA